MKDNTQSTHAAYTIWNRGYSPDLSFSQSILALLESERLRLTARQEAYVRKVFSKEANQMCEPIYPIAVLDFLTRKAKGP